MSGELIISGEVLPIYSNISSLNGWHTLVIFILAIIFLIGLFYYLKDVYLN